MPEAVRRELMVAAAGAVHAVADLPHRDAVQLGRMPHPVAQLIRIAAHAFRDTEDLRAYLDGVVDDADHVRMHAGKMRARLRAQQIHGIPPKSYREWDAKRAMNG